MQLQVSGLLLMSLASTCICGKIKVVDEPFGFNNPQGGNPSHGDRGEVPLITRYVPNPPSGPPFLIEHLNGKCYDFVENNYKYRFCPYQNVTQREQSYRWNAFHGVLGVWKTWDIENRTFSSMVMVHGDNCQGNLDRQVKVTFTCGDSEEVASVSEPSMCQYRMLFKTRFACPTDLFHVYPLLSELGRTKFEQIEEFYINKELTKKGYNKYMNELFIDEGLIYPTIAIRKSLIDDNIQHTPRPQQSKLDDQKIKYDGKERIEASTTEEDGAVESYASLMSRFYTKSQCVEKYREALKEIELLRDVIRQGSFQQSMGYLQNLFNAKENRPNTETTTASKKTKAISSVDLKNDSLSVIKHRETLRQNNEVGNQTDSKANNVKQRIDNRTNAIVALTNTKIQNNSLENKGNITKLSLKRKGDDGLLDDAENPLRNLQNRMSYSKSLRNRMKIHSRDRTDKNETS